MNRHDDNEFRPKPAAPKGKQSRAGERFLTRVLRGVNRAGGMPSRGPSTKPRPTLTRLGRGAGAAAFAGSKLGPRSRRVVIKSRIVNLKHVTPQAVDAHLRYIARAGVGYDGQPTQPYGPDTDTADWHEFAAAGRKDRHQFRFIVSPEDGARLTDLRDFTRELMATMERDLITDLEWIAVDHWDTDNPHTHVVLRGKDEWGKDLIIARNYLTDGMRLRACELSTRWLGLRTEMEILESLKILWFMSRVLLDAQDRILFCGCRSTRRYERCAGRGRRGLRCWIGPWPGSVRRAASMSSSLLPTLQPCRAAGAVRPVRVWR